MDKNNIIVFLDALGRTLFAEKVADRSDDNKLVVKNPVLVHIGGAGDGKMSLQLLPVFFKEFLANKDDDVVFSFPMANITMADPVNFDEKLYANYRQMFSALVIPNAGAAPKATINLFDEEK